jgi:cell division protein FtsN
MLSPERRHIPRTAMERLAYIHIEPGNGAIVLNVSGEGLCFHSIARLEKNGPIRFSILEQNRRIDACGELAWTDATQKVAGMRFTTLTAQASEQIHNWVSQPAAPLEEHKAPTLGSALLKAFPAFRARLSEPNADSSNPSAIAAALLKIRARMRLSGFSAGVATGLLLSAFGVGIFVSYAYRRQFGESLIHLGERLAAKPTADTQKLLPAPQVVSTAKEGVTPVGTQSPVRTQPSVRTQSPAEQPRNLLAQSLASPGKPQEQVVLKPQTSVNTAFRPADGAARQHSTVSAAETALPVPPPVSLGVPSLPTADLIPDKLRTPPQLELASPVRVRISLEESAVAPSMYFDLGRFKDELRADNIRSELAKLGLHANIVPRGHLWMNSYQVLVGPYNKEDEAKRVRKDLVSQGYKPRPFERGSRNFIFGSGLTLNGTRLPIGDLTISWESYVTEANVKFAQADYVLATANGRWIKQTLRYQHNELVYLRTANGSRILLEIHFSGLDRALVFRNSS